MCLCAKSISKTRFSSAHILYLNETMDDDTFDDIDEQSFIDDNDDDDENNNWGNMAQGQDTGGTAGPANPQLGGDEPEALMPSQDHDFQSQVNVVMRPRVGPERSYVPEPRPQNVETEVPFRLRLTTS
jgi:hypothetical protein